MDLVASFVLGLVLGVVLGYLAAMPRVKRLEKELALAKLRVSELGMALDLERSKAMVQAHKLE